MLIVENMQTANSKSFLKSFLKALSLKIGTPICVDKICTLVCW